MGAAAAKKPTNNQQLQQKHTQLDSVPSFAMSEFNPNSPFSKNLAKEMLIMLLALGLDVNYHNKQGYSPLHEAIRGKLKTLQSFLLSGFVRDLDVNIRSKALGNQM